MFSLSSKDVFACILALMSFYAQSQSAKIDSLLKVVETSSDTTKVNALQALTFEYLNYDVETAYFYSMEGYTLSDALEYKKGLAWSNTAIGLYHYFNGNYETALKYYRLGIDALDGAIYPDYPSYSYSRIANLYRVQSQYDSALFYYRKAIQNMPPNPSKDNLHTIYFNLGINYIEMEQYDSAITNIERSLAIRQELGDSLYIASSLNEMGRAFLGSGNFDSAAYYLDQAKSIGDEFNLPEILIFHSMYSSELALERGDYVEAIERIKFSLSILNEYDFLRLRIYSLYLLGHIYAEIGEYDGALDNLLNALSMNMSMENRKLTAQINFILGYIYYYQKNPQKAKEAAVLSQRIFQQIGLARRGAATDNLLGLIELYKGNYSTSAQFFDAGMAVYEELNDKKGIASILYNKSYIYLEQGEIAKVVNIQLEALELEKEISNIPGIIISYNSLGDLLTQTKDYKGAEEYLLKAKQLLARNPSISNKEENNLYLAKLYAAKRDFERAYDYLWLHKQDADSVFSLNSLNRSLQLSAILDLEKKELEIQNLNKERESKNVELALQQSQIRQQNLLLLLGGIAILFFLFLSYFLVRIIRKLRTTQQELIKAEKRASLSILVAGLSHEINNPLNFIKGGVETLRLSHTEWTHSELRSLHAIDEGVSRTSEIVSVLTQFQKQKGSTYQTCDVRKVISESLKEMKEDLPERIKVTIHPSEDALVNGNINELKQLFKELIKNSIQSIEEKNLSEEKGEINIRIDANNAQYTIHIKDNGVGIGADHLALMENPFFTTRAPNKGKGLGLYLVDYILHDHKGTISFDSEKDKGTLATVSLPKFK